MRIPTPSNLAGKPAVSQALPTPDALHASADPAGFASLLRQRVTAAPAPSPAPAPAAPPPATMQSNPAPRAESHAAVSGEKTASPAESTRQASAEAAHDDGAANDSTASNSTANDSTQSAEVPEQAPSAGHGRASARAARNRGAEPTARGAIGEAGADAQGTAATSTDAASPTASFDGVAAHHTAPSATADALAPWLVALQRVPAERDAGARGAATGGDDADGQSKDASALSGKPADTILIAFATDVPRGNLSAEPIAAAFASLVADAVAALDSPALSEGRSSSDALSATPGVDGASALLASSAPAATNAITAAPEPAAIMIPTPVDSPDFAQVLGVQLSVLAKDGVQKAELHLNPADMGPVSVQIVMDGTQARIDFGADVAATRHAIESGLPELASALRDAGFTLAGGGVSQQSQSRGQGAGTHAERGGGGGNGGSGARRIGDEGVARVSNAARRISTANGVDLYA